MMTLTERKIARKIAQDKWKAKNIEYVRRYGREWALKDRAKNIEKYREKERLASAKKRKEKPEYVKFYIKQWQQNNKGRMKFYYMKSKHGVTREKYFEMLESQEGKCAICEVPMKTPFIDHDHTTDKVRGLLCQHCNTGLGFFNDNHKSLEAAMRYLSKNL